MEISVEKLIIKSISGLTSILRPTAHWEFGHGLTPVMLNEANDNLSDLVIRNNLFSEDNAV